MRTSNILTVYKAFARPHLNDSDMIYHQAYIIFKKKFHQKFELIQYSAYLALAGARRDTSPQSRNFINN